MGANRSLVDLLYSGTTTEKLERAQWLYQELGDTLKNHPQISKALADLDQARVKLDTSMTTLAMGKQCSTCAQDTGGCCSAYMANNIDGLQLLVNHLLGNPPALSDNNQDTCCFLGETGCQFQVKPLFCLNYNCSHINRMLGKDGMDELTAACGAFLAQQSTLEALLTNKINRLILLTKIHTPFDSKIDQC